MNLTTFANQLNKGAAMQDKVLTENGAVVYGSAGDNLVELHARATEFRNASNNDIEDAVEKAYAEDPVKAVKLIFQNGDVREGKGERRFFGIALRDLIERHPDVAREVLPLIPEYTRWDHLTRLIMDDKHPEIRAVATNIVKEQFTKDMASETPSLLAKWMPSIQSKKPEDRKLALRLEKVLSLDHKGYRKALSAMRDKLNVIEKYLSANDLDKIDMENLTSKQQLKYAATLERKLQQKRMEYLQAVAEGRATINASVLVPHEIVKDYMRGSEQVKPLNPALEILWNALPDKVEGNGNTMVIRDGSYSMTSCISDQTKVRMLDVATALSIYTAQKLSGPLKNKFITFSSHPEIVDLSNQTTLHDAIAHCLRYTDCSNTNLKKTFDMLLDIAKQNHLSQDEIPSNLLIVSDMEFDNAMSRSFNTGGYRDLPTPEVLFETIRKEWSDAGYEMPTLVFWQLNPDRTIYPDLGQNVVFLSGFSTNILDMVMRGEFEQTKEEIVQEVNAETGKTEEKVVSVKRTMTPLEQVEAIIGKARYDAVGEAVERGVLKERENALTYSIAIGDEMQLQDKDGERLPEPEYYYDTEPVGEIETDEEVDIDDDPYDDM